MKTIRKRLGGALCSGCRKGGAGFLWMLRILVPVSFFTLLLDVSGTLRHLDFILSPLMGLFGLPSAAALPLIIGLLTGIYGAVAALTVLPLSVPQMTLIAVFVLIAHNMVQEGIVQAKSGIHPVKATLFRLFAASITVMIMARFLSPEAAAPANAAAFAGTSEGFWSVLAAWTIEMALLSVKIFVIIMAVMCLIEIMKAFNWMDRILKAISPVLGAMGLSRNVGVLWLTACLFGIAYGAAVIVEEVKDGSFSEDELERLHLSIGINHAVIEDPALFLPLGLNPLLLWLPRLAAAIVAVHLLNLWQKYGVGRDSSTATNGGEHRVWKTF